MVYRHSYGEFTTKSYGVIEHTSTKFGDDSKKRKRRPKLELKFATRWPSAAPLKRKKTISAPKQSLDKRAMALFKQRFPGQQPKKGQINEIKAEILKSTKTISNFKKQKTNHIRKNREKIF